MIQSADSVRQTAITQQLLWDQNVAHARCCVDVYMLIEGREQTAEKNASVQEAQHVALNTNIGEKLVENKFRIRHLWIT